MASYNLKINGEARVVDVDPDTPMLYVLRDNLALKGPKFGCGLATQAPARIRQRRGGALLRAADR